MPEAGEEKTFTKVYPPTITENKGRRGGGKFTETKRKKVVFGGKKMNFPITSTPRTIPRGK